MRFEPAIHAYRSVRAKRHGAGQGSHLRALKMALLCFFLTNGQMQSRAARFAYWLALYGTPRLFAAGNKGRRLAGLIRYAATTCGIKRS